MIKSITIFAFILISNAICWGQSESAIISINDTISLKLERTKFEPKGSKLDYYKNNFLYSINGRPIFGTDGDIPKYILKAATLKVGMTNYNLQINDMYNPWFGEKPNEQFFTFEKEGPEMRLRGYFSDGAGSYGAEWLIVGLISVRTVLSKDEWILIEYSKN